MKVKIAMARFNSATETCGPSTYLFGNNGFVIYCGFGKNNGLHIKRDGPSLRILLGKVYFCVGYFDIEELIACLVKKIGLYEEKIQNIDLQKTVLFKEQREFEELKKANKSKNDELNERERLFNVDRIQLEQDKGNLNKEKQGLIQELEFLKELNVELKKEKMDFIEELESVNKSLDESEIENKNLRTENEDLTESLDNSNISLTDCESEKEELELKIEELEKQKAVLEEQSEKIKKRTECEVNAITLKLEDVEDKLLECQDENKRLKDNIKDIEEALQDSRDLCEEFTKENFDLWCENTNLLEDCIELEMELPDEFEEEINEFDEEEDIEDDYVAFKDNVVFSEITNNIPNTPL